MAEKKLWRIYERYAMLKKLAYFLVLVLFFTLAPDGRAAGDNSFVTVVNPVRGNDFWDVKNQQPQEAINGQLEILKKYHVNATWLIRYDALQDKLLLGELNNLPDTDEKGLFLEVTPSWTKDAGVSYKTSASWHFAGSVFLAGYDTGERKKLIDRAFEQFKVKFGVYPKSVGAWWIDAYSMSYMQEKYQMEAALIVADQYSTDNYQIWGQFWQVPYYPAKTNVLNPAQSPEHKIPVVVMQWAARDPVNGYGKGVEESTLSVQPNDYMDYHNLGIDYFSKLVDIYTTQKLSSFNQLVVGLENSYSWQKYSGEYQKQIEVLSKKRARGQFSFATMSTFANWYKARFPGLSPEHVIVADDPLGSGKKVVWFMNPFYRAGWFYTGDRSLFRDIRQYIDGSQELCLTTACQEINFAFFATRVLDEVTKGNRWVIDEGKLTDFNVTGGSGQYTISYKTESSKLKTIGLLPRDIKVDAATFSIDTVILQANSQTEQLQKDQVWNYFKVLSGGKMSQVGQMLLGLIKFLLFIIIALFIPGFVLISSFKNLNDFLTKTFLGLTSGIVVFTLVFYFSSLFKVWWFIFIYLGVMLLFFIKRNLYQSVKLKFLKLPLSAAILILAGTIFQVMPVIRSGLVTSYGIGFWGPNAHDGIWHMALVNQLVGGVVPQNPIFSGEALKNYHYFYDLLIAATYKIASVPTADLIFRFYPVLFSLLFGIGTYLLAQKLFKSNLVSFFGIYLAYFTGSFGWVVEFIRERHIGGESAFWSNQPVSFNLNPPFAISLVILIAFVYLLISFFEGEKSVFKKIILITILGSLVSFKAYAALLAIGALILLVIFNIIRKRDFSLVPILAGSGVLSFLILLPNYGADILKSGTGGIFTFAPFWFVHSMIDSPDRVGWTRLTLTRIVGFEQKNYLKFFAAETLGLLIFWGGNLGVRILSFGLLGKIKILSKEPILLYLFFITILALVIPLLFIQAGNPWNAIQFFYYGLYTTALFSSLTLAWIFERGKAGKIIVAILLLIAPINALVTANSYIPSTPHAALSHSEKLALDFLFLQPPGIVLTYPFDPNLRKNIGAPIPLPVYETTSYVSAFSGKPVFVEDEIQQDILRDDYKGRIAQSREFFHGGTKQWSRDFLKSNNITYVYVLALDDTSFNPKEDGLEQIFESSEVKIYRVNN